LFPFLFHFLPPKRDKADCRPGWKSSLSPPAKNGGRWLVGGKIHCIKETYKITPKRSGCWEKCTAFQWSWRTDRAKRPQKDHAEAVNYQV
jgi:hypothetical protein